MSKSLIVRCFLENAKEEGKKVVLTKDENTYEVIRSYDVIKNTLVVNEKKIGIRNLRESLDGYSMRINEYVLQAV